MSKSKKKPPAPDVRPEVEPRIGYVALDELERWPGNPKKHRSADIEQSVERFGFVQPLILDERTGRLVAGHGRLEALSALKAAGKPAPARVRVADDGAWLVPVVRGVAFASDADAEAYLLADNHLVEIGGWNDDLLADMLRRTQVADGDMMLAGTGFGVDEAHAILAAASAPPVTTASPVDEVIGEDDEEWIESVKNPDVLVAPFPYFGGKRSIAKWVWERFGQVRHYIEPFCGSAAMLLASPAIASLEVVNDANGFVANFWRAVKHQAGAVARHADYPVSHVDMGARHVWLMEQRAALGAALQDPDRPGDAKVAGWWLWGQCAWIASGWCEWERGAAKGADNPKVVEAGSDGVAAFGQIPHVTSAGQGVQGVGKVPHVTSAGQGAQARGKIPSIGDAGTGVHAVGKIPGIHGGRGVQAMGQIPFVGNSGRGVEAIGQIPQVRDSGSGGIHARVGASARSTIEDEDGFPVDLLTSAGRVAWSWLHRLAARIERVRIFHGSWDRCLNTNFGGESTAVFLDPPYRAYENLYGPGVVPTADAACAWAREHANLRVVLCGHVGDYDLPGWRVVRWSRPGLTFGGGGTTASEALWLSPACLP